MKKIAKHNGLKSLRPIIAYSLAKPGEQRQEKQKNLTQRAQRNQSKFRQVGRKSRRAADWPSIQRWIAPDLNRIVWFGSCRTSPIESPLGNLNQSSSGWLWIRYNLRPTAQIRRGHA
jgi:hypothetical protein